MIVVVVVVCYCCRYGWCCWWWFSYTKTNKSSCHSTTKPNSNQVIRSQAKPNHTQQYIPYLVQKCDFLFNDRQLQQRRNDNNSNNNKSYYFLWLTFRPSKQPSKAQFHSNYYVGNFNKIIADSTDKCDRSTHGFNFVDFFGYFWTVQIKLSGLEIFGGLSAKFVC